MRVSKDSNASPSPKEVLAPVYVEGLTSPAPVHPSLLPCPSTCRKHVVRLSRCADGDERATMLVALRQRLGVHGASLIAVWSGEGIGAVKAIWPEFWAIHKEAADKRGQARTKGDHSGKQKRRTARSIPTSTTSKP
jgi:hypothetical protein